MNQATTRVLMICLTIVFLALVGAVLYDCDMTNVRRLECVKLGHAPAECKRMLDSYQH